jgi:F-type H+-transporting ATPase subunit b
VLIDWFTVIAQIVNFLILVGLLKYFLYGPIVSAMDKREEKIKSRLNEAEKKKEEAEAERSGYEKKRKEMEERRETLLEEAKDEAEKRRKKLIDEARQEADDRRRQWQEALEREKETFIRQLRRLAGEEVFHIARRTFSQIADADVQKQAVSVFLDRMDRLDPSERDRFLTALEKGEDRARVKSGFDIDPDEQERIKDRLRSVLKEEMKLSFSVDEMFILGVQLSTRGHKIAWNTEDYLADLEEKAREALNRELEQSGTAVGEEKVTGSSGKSKPDSETDQKGQKNQTDEKAEPDEDK